jgi:PHD/YefM family antitoxin component YafN of YafNO toxin-antitoxin module
MDLEYLRNENILAKINSEFKPLLNNNRDHVILYLETWANIMQEELLKEIKIESQLAQSIKENA